MLRYIMKIEKKNKKNKIRYFNCEYKKNNDLFFDEEGEGMVW